jgi:hypothetical protein
MGLLQRVCGKNTADRSQWQAVPATLAALRYFEAIERAAIAAILKPFSGLYLLDECA